MILYSCKKEISEPPASFEDEMTVHSKNVLSLIQDFENKIESNLKTARLFFKAANLTGYFGNYTYYLAPHYHARDARFYFGINWRFHD